MLGVKYEHRAVEGNAMIAVGIGFIEEPQGTGREAGGHVYHR